MIMSGKPLVITSSLFICLVFPAGFSFFNANLAVSQVPVADQNAAKAEPAAQTNQATVESQKPIENSNDKLTALNPTGTVQVDAANKRLLVKGRVVLREGQLEMLACPRQTKEHESIIAVDAPAQLIHAGLLALGAKSGTGVKFQPKFQPPTGEKLLISISWKDAQGKDQKVSAQSWVRNATRRYFVASLPKIDEELKFPEESGLIWDNRQKELLWYGHMTPEKKAELKKTVTDPRLQASIDKFFNDSQFAEMKADFVFVGSLFEADPDSGKQRYLADGGDLICVANFSTATIDVATASTNTGEDLLFEAYTERIPPVETPITLEIQLAEATAPKP